MILGVSDSVTQDELYDAYKTARKEWESKRFVPGEEGAYACERLDEIEDAYRDAKDVLISREPIPVEVIEPTPMEDYAEIEVFLELVTDDETSSLEKATKLCDARKKYEEGYKKKMTEEAQKNQGSQQGSGSSGSGELSFAAKMAQKVNKAFDTQNNNN